MRDAIHYDQQAWISEALRRPQELETLLVAYLALAFHLDPTAAGTAGQFTERLQELAAEAAAMTESLRPLILAGSCAPV